MFCFVLVAHLIHFHLNALWVISSITDFLSTAVWGLFFYCPCFPVLSIKCRLMALNFLLLAAIESNAYLMMWLNSSILEWLNPSLTHGCDFQYPGSPVGPKQPSRKTHQLFIHFSWKGPLW